MSIALVVVGVKHPVTWFALFRQTNDKRLKIYFFCSDVKKKRKRKIFESLCSKDAYFKEQLRGIILIVVRKRDGRPKLRVENSVKQNEVKAD